MLELGLYLGFFLAGVFAYLGWLLCEIRYRRKRINKYRYLNDRNRRIDIPKFVKR